MATSAVGVQAIVDSCMPTNTIAYVLWHGGSAVTNPVMTVGPRTLETLNNTVQYLPRWIPLSGR